jgi:serine/threonine-protein kinase
MREGGRVGATLAGKYIIRRLIGSGTMGEVYEAKHAELGKRVAVKLMNATYAETPEVVARFKQEARAASAVESDYIVQVFDAGKDPELGLFMITELLTGENLEARLAREGRLETAPAVVLGQQIARGLARAHAAKIVHRDLKPANIFLAKRDDGSLLTKILDFGISKVTLDDMGAISIAGGANAGITAQGVTLGTPQYMSPEQAMAQPDIDGRSDVWSLAAVLYEALSGVSAFPDTGSYIDVMMSIVNNPVTQLTRVAPWVPDRLAEVVHAGLSRDRKERPDAVAFARRLVESVPELGLGSTSRLSLYDAPPLMHDTLQEDDDDEEGGEEADIPVSFGDPVSQERDEDLPDTQPGRDAPPDTQVPATPPAVSSTDKNPSTPQASSTADRVEVFRRTHREK